MLKYVNAVVSFAEVPDEVCLSIDISGCPRKCKGCHSAYLREDKGTPLTIHTLDTLIKKNEGITCVCLLGGDQEVLSLKALFKHIKENYNLKTCLYTGREDSEVWTNKDDAKLMYYISPHLNYLKTGPYIEELGGLNKETTNQRMYEKHVLCTGTADYRDITYKFWRINDKKRN